MESVRSVEVPDAAIRAGYFCE